MMRYAVESWDPGYGASAADESLEPAREPVDPGVELPPGQWRPLPTGGPGAAAETVVFVDGVRRIDCRIWITDGTTGGSNSTGQRDVTRPGLCASVGAGAVRCEPGRASVVAVEVERGLHTASPGAEPIKTSRAGTYELRPTAGDDDGDLYNGIHRHMTELEMVVSRSAEDEALVVFDGPLRGRDHTAGVGYVKTQHVQYLDPELQPVVFALEPGQRSPLFAVGGTFARWSWYLRLPGPRAHGLSGIVRLELPKLGDVSCAVARAEMVSATLPRFASEPHKEARAPQNLYPIAGLEHTLRHRLGDPFVLERSLRIGSAGPIGAAV